MTEARSGAKSGEVYVAEIKVKVYMPDDLVDELGDEIIEDIFDVAAEDLEKAARRSLRTWPRARIVVEQ
jgi:hypothetical protein